MTAPDLVTTGREHRWLTNDDMAEAAGVAPSDVRRFWRALGFPDAGDEARYTESDLETLRLLKDSLGEAGADLSTGFRLARAVGQNVARMSDWQVAALAGSVGSEVPVGGTEESRVRAESAARLAERVGPALEQVLLHAWRRHLLAAIDRLDEDPAADGAEQSVAVTVGFADLVAFSALSNEMDSDRLGELVEIFEARSGDVVAAHEGRMIKTLGDSVLFVADDAERALDIAFGLIEVIGGDPRLPDVSVGLATGMVVTRLGDVFGPPVNLAARLTALARRNRVLVDEATVNDVRPGRYDLLRLTARPVRGFGLVAPIAVQAR